ncbi:DUF5956 family protein [Cellulomonas massiliensis]|uniref:DUF5956 family protein n=1 Tax=Cellulomonas massiliensis TaxID=1465811 RepID=UPI0002EEB952|nr:DUF5956 family protein [Cellulomonas massiliensis]
MSGDERWAQIITAETPRDGNWIDLPEDLRSTLVAFAAGPGLVRADEVRPGTGRVRVEVRTSDGGARRWERHLDEDDVAETYAELVTYLHEAGVAPPPRWYRWSLLAPEELTAEDLERRLNLLPEQGGDRMTSAQYAARVCDLVTGLVRPSVP